MCQTLLLIEQSFLEPQMVSESRHGRCASTLFLNLFKLIKVFTWNNRAQGGSGSASNIKFQNVEMQNVKNPIIIDQNYCDQDEPCDEQVPLTPTLI